METFKLNETFTAVCEWKKTRMAFKHEATLVKNGQEIETTKICYSNRTWESYQYQSVLFKLCDKSKELSKEEKEKFATLINNNFVEKNKKEIDKKFGVIGAMASLGDILTDDKKQSNDWKKRMLTAGLNLSMPEDWDSLKEEEKTRRLDEAIAYAK